MLLRGEFYNGPIKSNPQNILDPGTGTGICAMDIAEYVGNIRQSFWYVRETNRPPGK